MLRDFVLKSREAFYKISKLDTQTKNEILLKLAAFIDTKKDEILFKNSIDVEAAKGLSKALVDRLTLNTKRISEVIEGIKDIAILPDPVGEVIDEWEREYDGKFIKIKKVRAPLGVIFIVYEARPSVTVEAAALCIKSGNAVILRGGSEAFNTNMIFVELIGKVLKGYGLEDSVRYIPTTDRQAIYEILKMNDLVDLVIPRGSEEMIKEI
ncbi:MAG: aldehyde dehydrogenase family protein, partial [bacterium]|nr:aldehyde dehydrogenase family protein [bacterium]